MKGAQEQISRGVICLLYYIHQNAEGLEALRRKHTIIPPIIVGVVLPGAGEIAIGALRKRDAAVSQVAVHFLEANLAGGDVVKILIVLDPRDGDFLGPLFVAQELARPLVDDFEAHPLRTIVIKTHCIGLHLVTLSSLGVRNCLFHLVPRETTTI